MDVTFATQTALRSPTGAELNLYYQRAATNNERGVLQINHGLAEHAARYARFAAFMAKQGFHVYAHDHRGHGFTKAPGAPSGVFGSENGTELVLQDVAAVHQQIQTIHAGMPIIMFGHSMGGLIALNYVLRYPQNIRAAAVWNANFSAGLLGRVAKGILGYERMRLGSDAVSNALPALTFRSWAAKIKDKRTSFDWLSRDPAEVDKYVNDPLCGWDASVGMWASVFELVFFGADDRNFSEESRSIPFHLVGGQHDPATNGGKAVTDLANRMRRLGYDVTDRVYDQTRHESLNETNRDDIMKDFADWANQVVMQATAR